jgi:hypothetical protein
MSVLGLQHHVFDLKSSYLFADLLTGRVLASHPLCWAARITLHHSHAGKPFSLRRAARITLRQSQAVSYSCSLADWPCVGKPPSLRRAARITLHHSHASRFITATHHASSQPRILRQADLDSNLKRQLCTQFGLYQLHEFTRASPNGFDQITQTVQQSYSLSLHPTSPYHAAHDNTQSIVPSL